MGAELNFHSYPFANLLLRQGCNRNLLQALLTQLRMTNDPVPDDGKSAVACIVCNFEVQLSVLGSREEGESNSPVKNMKSKGKLIDDTYVVCHVWVRIDKLRGPVD